MIRTPPKVSQHLLSCSMFLLVTMTMLGCERTLVYGERTGFNLAIRADAAESSPLEVNIGLKRTVVGIIPPSEESTDDAPKGEAVNMISRFDLDYGEDDAGPFAGTLTIGTAFASGAAALEIANRPDGGTIAAEILRREIRLSDDPLNVQVRNTLGQYIAKSEDNLKKYIEEAGRRGVFIDPNNSPRQRALEIIDDKKRLSLNQEIITALRDRGEVL